MIFKEPMTALIRSSPSRRNWTAVPSAPSGGRAPAAARARCAGPGSSGCASVIRKRTLAKFPATCSRAGNAGAVLIAMALEMWRAPIFLHRRRADHRPLDVTTQARFSICRRAEAGAGLGVLFHHPRSGRRPRVAGRVAVMRRGEMWRRGDADKVLTRPRARLPHRGLVESLPQPQAPRPSRRRGARGARRPPGLGRVYGRKRLLGPPPFPGARGQSI